MATKQKDGRYRTKVKVGVTPDGRDINKWVSGKTKKELEDEKRRAIAHYITGTGLEDDRLFGEYARIWFQHKCKDIAPSTIESYRTALNKEILPVFAARKMRAIEPTELQLFMDQFAHSSQTRITMIYASLTGIFSMARKDRVIVESPMRDVKKPKAREAEEKIALTEEQRRAIEHVAATHPQGAYLAAMYYLGARPGEIRGLRWGDFDWQEGCVHIQRDIDYKDGGKAGELKTKASKRRVPVPPELREILLPLRAMPDMYLFQGERSGDAIAKTTADRLWVKLMLECGMVRKLSKGEKNYADRDIRAHYEPTITPHVMRHNYVTMCWESGIDVYTTMKLVGHKSIKTTMDIYTHLSNQQMEIAKQQVADMFAKNKKLPESCQR